MSRPLQALGVLLVVAVATTLTGPAPSPAGAARADRADRPSTPAVIAVTAKANRPHHFNSSINVDVPAGGTATVTSPSLEADQRSARVEVGAAALSDEKPFTFMAFAMMQAGSPGRRVQVCLTMTAKSLVANDEEAVDLGQVTAQSGTRALIRVYYCLRLAQLVAEVLAEQASGNVRQLAPACGVAPIAIPSSYSESGGQPTLTATGPLTEKPKKAKVKIKCSVKSGAYVYDIKPRKKGASLKSAVGANLTIGVASPPSATAGAEVKVSFKAP